MEYHLQLELWRGNVSGAIQIARQRNELSDWIVAMAPLASHDLWELVSAEYAEQLEDDGQYHKAATYLLAAHKVYQAIDLFRRHRLFKEAVSLARIRLSQVDPLLEDLYTEWGQNLMKEGQYEQAAKCYLAMRHIQEAGKVLSQRQDQSSLTTACHVTLLANEKQQGHTYAYKVITQYLMGCEWHEAYKFISEYDSLKMFLPLVSTHELLVKHMAELYPMLILTRKPTAPAMFTDWEKKGIQKAKTELPEFLLDKSEIDPVVPWEPSLIGKHTFPHHLLRVWHQYLDIPMVTQELRSMYTAISQLVSIRQNVADLPAMLVWVSMHVSLCLLSLLTSETSNAIVHLLQAVSTLYQANHLSLQQALCRLMLPQGPKYILKVQQEFNASRVLITMESHGDVDKAGGENLNTIRKFLTEIRADSAISMSSLRCRELDCLRAYYYLAVLDFFKDSLPPPQPENDSVDGMPNGRDALSNQIMAVSSGNHKQTLSGDKIKNMDSIHVTSDDRSLDLISKLSKVDCKPSDRGDEEDLTSLDQNGKLSHSPVPLDKISAGNGDCQIIYNQDSDKIQDEREIKLAVSDSYKSRPSPPKPGYLFTLSSSITHQSSAPTVASPDSSSVDPPCVSSSLPSHNLSPLKKAANGSSQPHVRSPPPPVLTSPTLPGKSIVDPESSPGRVTNVSASSSDMTKSHSPSWPGFLKVPAQLTHMNLLRLSKGILWDVQAKREALTETLGYIHQAISQHLLLNRPINDGSQCDLVNAANSSKGIQQTLNSALEEDGGCHDRRSDLLSSSETVSDILRQHTENKSPRNLSPNPCVTNSSRSLTPQPVTRATHSGPIRSLSENFDLQRSPVSPSRNSITLSVEQDLFGGSISQEPVAFHKARKVLWMDGKESCRDAGQTIEKSAFQISRLAPDGSPIPVEWDGLPVDTKFTMPYVTLALLKQEQENISQELKRVPDVSKIPFPAISTGVKKLLHTSLRSPHMTMEEKQSYFKQLSDWSSVFAVTSHQQDETAAMFAATAAEYLTEG